MAFSSGIFRRLHFGSILKMNAMKVYWVQIPQKLPKMFQIIPYRKVYRNVKRESESFMMISGRAKTVASKDDTSASFYLGRKAARRSPRIAVVKKRKQAIKHFLNKLSMRFAMFCNVLLTQAFWLNSNAWVAFPLAWWWREIIQLFFGEHIGRFVAFSFLPSFFDDKLCDVDAALGSVSLPAVGRLFFLCSPLEFHFCFSSSVDFAPLVPLEMSGLPHCNRSKWDHREQRSSIWPYV